MLKKVTLFRRGSVEDLVEPGTSMEACFSIGLHIAM